MQIAMKRVSPIPERQSPLRAVLLDQRPLPARRQSSGQGHEAVVDGCVAVVVGHILNPGVYAYQRMRSYS